MWKGWKTVKKLAVIVLSAVCGAAFLTACSNPMNDLKQYETETLSVVSPTEITYTEPFSFVGTSETQIVHLFDEKMMLGDKLFGKAHVQYRVISQKPVLKQQEISETVSYPGLTSQELDAPETIPVQRDGQTIEMNLHEVKFESEGISQTETGRFIHLTSNTSFGYTTSIPTAGGTKRVEYRDEATGQTVYADLPFQSMNTVQDWHWRDDVKIPITVTTYDANYYLLGDKKIPKNEETTALSGYENDLLQSLGLSPESHRITRYAWDGEPYEKDGELCRNAVAYGGRYVIECQAVFSGDVPLPDVQKETHQGIAAYTATASLGNRTAINVSRSGSTLSLHKSMSEQYEERPLLTTNELMRLRQSECVVKRSMKQRDLKNNLITAYPIFNTGETAFKYRFEYLAKYGFPDPDSVKFEDVNRESTKGIALSERVFDAAGWWDRRVNAENSEPSKQQPDAPPKNSASNKPGQPSLFEELCQFPRFDMICKLFPQHGFSVSEHMKMGQLVESVERARQESQIDGSVYQQLNSFLKEEIKALSDARKEAAGLDV